MGDGAGGAVIRGAGIARVEAGAARAATGAAEAAEEAGAAARTAGGLAAEAPGVATAAAQAARGGLDEALGRVGEMSVKRVVKGAGTAAAGGALLGAGGLAAYTVSVAAKNLLTNREKALTEQVARLADKSTTAANAMLQTEADTGGAWADPTWPARFHAMLTRQGSKPLWAADMEVHERPEDYSTAELRSGWIGWLYGPTAARPLTPEEQAAVEKYLRDHPAGRRQRPSDSELGQYPGFEVDETRP